MINNFFFTCQILFFLVQLRHCIFCVAVSVEIKIIFVEKNKRRMGGETKKGEGGRRSERKEEREAGDGESNKISSNLSSAKPLCSILFPLFCR